MELPNPGERRHGEAEVMTHLKILSLTKFKMILLLLMLIVLMSLIALRML